jgi:hypothetical protein
LLLYVVAINAQARAIAPQLRAPDAARRLGVAVVRAEFGIEATLSVLPAGIRAAAARNSALLYEPWRRLPDSPMMLLMIPPRCRQ